MGFFKRIRVKNYTEAAIIGQLTVAAYEVVQSPWSEDKLTAWAVWREALARKRGEKAPKEKK